MGRVDYASFMYYLQKFSNICKPPINVCDQLHASSINPSMENCRQSFRIHHHQLRLQMEPQLKQRTPVVKMKTMMKINLVHYSNSSNELSIHQVRERKTKLTY